MRGVVFLSVLMVAMASAPTCVRALAPELSWEDAPRVVLPRFDAEKARLKAESELKPGVPYPFAEALTGRALDQALAKVVASAWVEAADGSRRWSLAIEAPGAKNLNFHFEPFRLPYGARLWISDPEKRQVLGPYEDRDNPPSGAFWTPILEGDRAVLLLELPRMPVGSNSPSPASSAASATPSRPRPELATSTWSVPKAMAGATRSGPWPLTPSAAAGCAPAP